MSQPASPPEHFDFGTLSSSALPDLSLITQPKLTLDLGATDLSVSLDELHASADQHQQAASSLLPATSLDHQSHSDIGQGHSRRWTSLSELGRAVLKPSLSRSNLRLGSLNERGGARPRAAAAGRRLSEASAPGPPASIYSSYRTNRNLFKLWSHEPTIESSPAGSPAIDVFPSLPPMSELFGGSATFDPHDLSLITEPLFAGETDEPGPASKSRSSPLSAPAAQPALDTSHPSPPSSPSPLSSPAASSSEHPVGFASAVQSPVVVDAKDLPLPPTPSLKSCQSSPIVPTIERVLSKAEEEAEADCPAVPEDKPGGEDVASPATAAAPAGGGGGDGGDGGGKDSEEEEPPAPEPTADPKTAALSPPPTAAHTASRTHLAGILGRKKKTLPASTGSGTPSFFKLFLLKGLGFKATPAASPPPASSAA